MTVGQSRALPPPFCPAVHAPLPQTGWWRKRLRRAWVWSERTICCSVVARMAADRSLTTNPTPVRRNGGIGVGLYNLAAGSFPSLPTAPTSVSSEIEITPTHQSRWQSRWETLRAMTRRWRLSTTCRSPPSVSWVSQVRPTPFFPLLSFYFVFLSLPGLRLLLRCNPVIVAFAAIACFAACNVTHAHALFATKRHRRSVACLAGVFYGVNFDPPTYLMDHGGSKVGTRV